VLNYLGRNGKSHINEIHRAIGCSKPILIRTIDELERRGLVWTYREGNKRVVVLKSYIPKSVLYLLSLTITLSVIALITSVNNFDLTVSALTFGGDVKVIYSIPAYIPILAYVLGVWTSFVALKHEDLDTFAQSVVRKLIKPK